MNRKRSKLISAKALNISLHYSDQKTGVMCCIYIGMVYLSCRRRPPPPRAALPTPSLPVTMSVGIRGSNR